MDLELAATDQEIQRLGLLFEQVDALSRRRSQESKRVVLVEELRRAQTGPVRMLDELSRAIPDGLWLSELRQSGDDIVVYGRAVALDALSDLMANLEDSGHLAPPVERDSQLEETAQGEIIRFGLRLGLVAPGF